MARRKTVREESRREVGTLDMVPTPPCLLSSFFSGEEEVVGRCWRRRRGEVGRRGSPAFYSSPGCGEVRCGVGNLVSSVSFPCPSRLRYPSERAGPVETRPTSRGRARLGGVSLGRRKGGEVVRSGQVRSGRACARVAAAAAVAVGARAGRSGFR